MQDLSSNIPVPEPILLSVIVSCQNGTHQMLDNIVDWARTCESLLKSRDS
jgi:hypothetical protein